MRLVISLLKLLIPHLVRTLYLFGNTDTHFNFNCFTHSDSVEHTNKNGYTNTFNYSDKNTWRYPHSNTNPNSVTNTYEFGLCTFDWKVHLCVFRFGLFGYPFSHIILYFL